MWTVCFVLLAAFGSGLRSRATLQIENAALRHQLAVLQRQSRGRPRLRPVDRLFWTWLRHLWPGWRRALVIVKPDTVLRWHRRGFRLCWRWKSRRRGPGRPRIPRAVRTLIRDMCLANPTWGAPRIHGELLKLGIAIAESTVGQYLGRRRPPPSQSWRTFLNNHVGQLASVDFFVVPTLTFRVLWVFVVLAHDRRQILHVNVTGHPTAEWTAQQIRNAFPWDTAPRFLLRDRDGTYGPAFRACLEAMEIRGADRAPESLAESVRGKTDWINSTRVPRSRDRAQRAVRAAHPSIVRRLLPSPADASGVGQGCAHEPGC